MGDAPSDAQQIQWTVQLERVIAKEAEQCLCYSVLHRESEAIYSKYNTYIVLPVIVLSTVAGTLSASSATVFPGNSSGASLGIGALSIGVGILNTIGSYFGWNSRAVQHKVASITYGKLHRFLMIELSLPRSSRMTCKDLLKTMREQLDRLYEIAPAIHHSVISEFKKKHGSDALSKPEICNGLDAIKIYNPAEDEQREATPAPTRPRIDVRILAPGEAMPRAEI